MASLVTLVTFDVLIVLSYFFLSFRIKWQYAGRRKMH
jgi:hypothetical protein